MDICATDFGDFAEFGLLKTPFPQKGTKNIWQGGVIHPARYSFQRFINELRWIAIPGGKST